MLVSGESLAHKVRMSLTKADKPMAKIKEGCSPAVTSKISEVASIIAKEMVTDFEPNISKEFVFFKNPALSGILYAKKGDDCKKLETGAKGGTGPICKPPGPPKPLKPYEYGYCKEPEPEMPMSCPPKIVRRGRGPCCHTEQEKTGGCKTK